MSDCAPKDIVTAPFGPFTVHDFPRIEQPTTITCMAGNEEMLKVAPDGFWVRGVKVNQDDNEAETVYNGFKAWMMWAQMTRDYK